MTAGKMGALHALHAPPLALKGLFTHVALDEAGHAHEPEALCSLVHLLPSGNVHQPVYAGLGGGLNYALGSLIQLGVIQRIL
jgi:hypothetical protein